MPLPNHALKLDAAFQEMARIVAAEMHKSPERKARIAETRRVCESLGMVEIRRCHVCGEFTEVKNPCCNVTPLEDGE